MIHQQRRESAASRPIASVSVFGLGKLGAVVAGWFAARGIRVVGYDPLPAVVEAVRRGRAPVREPGLQRLFDQAGDRLEAVADPKAAVVRTDASVVLVPTPSEPDGSYRLDAPVAACEAIGRALRAEERSHLVVMKSTVLPGDCERVLVPVLERASGRRCGHGLGFVYHPEFLALGDAVEQLDRPDLVLIGASDARAAEAWAQLVRGLLGPEAPIEILRLVEAELVKLALNTFVTTKIAFANSLAALCERLPGADVDAVTRALGRDRRVGARALRGGLGFGGPCFPRDNRALVALGRRLGVPLPLAEATDASNREPLRHVLARVAAAAAPGERVAVLGLAYKPRTPVVEESQGVELARRLAEAGYRVSVFDPLAAEAAREPLGARVEYAGSAQACVEGARVVVIATPWPEFARVDFARPPSPPTVLDCWGMIPRDTEVPGGLVRLGRGPESEAGDAGQGPARLRVEGQGQATG